MPDSLILFVYGSLMRGESNHVLLAGQQYLGPACTEPRYRLVEFGPYPAMLADGAVSVAGELFQVTGEALARVDILEEHPHVYERASVRLLDGRNALAYLLNSRLSGPFPAIPSGSWRAHRQAR